MNFFKNWTLRKLVIAEWILVVILAVAYFAMTSNFDLGAKLKEWKLVPLPENFTELYFTDHLNLPNSISPNQKRYFEFTIHNLENKVMTYKYEIYVNLGDGTEEAKETSESTESTQSKGEEGYVPEKVLIKQFEVTLIHDETRNIPVTFELPKVAKRNQIVVNLINKNQEIFFWANGE